MMVKEAVPATGAKSLEVVVKADPKAWLAATSDLVQCTRAASEYLFSALAVNTESPLEKLLTVNFDAEQIWQQIDLQATPTLNKIRKSLRKLEKTPPNKLFQFKGEKKSTQRGSAKEKSQELESDEDSDSEDLDDEEISGSDDDKEDGDDSGNEDEVEDGSKSEEEYSDYDEEEKKAVEDKFLKLTDMEKFLDRADAEDAGITEDGSQDDEDDGEDEEEDDDDDLEMDEAFDFSARLADKDDGDNTWGPKYSDFIGKGKKQKPKPSKRQDSDDEPGDDDLEDDDEDEDDEGPEAMVTDRQIVPAEEGKLSAHERQQEKTKRRIEQLEKSNLESKDWTMQGEVSASRRSKNSALEVELDFEHGARPAPVITEEVTQSLEDMIRSRIIEGTFDDPQPRAPPVTAAPKERMEMDEEKSKKGLGEIYEQEYMENTGLAAAATPAMEALKAEASALFRGLCNRLDALSHFHFAPKPKIEEMEVKVDVPALAMEEVAPLAISDASMLAPEEVYKGEGIIKGESELTPEERKRRRAQKKRKRKGAKKAEENSKRVRTINGLAKDPLKELIIKSTPVPEKRTSSFSKSAKVFAALDVAKEKGNKPDKPDKPAINASHLKL